MHTIDSKVTHMTIKTVCPQIRLCASAAESLHINSFTRAGQLWLRCSKPSVFTTAASTSWDLRNCMQASLRQWQWCCSAKANVVATVCTSRHRHNLSSQMSLSLCMSYLSAASSKCWAMTASRCIWNVARPWTLGVRYHQSGCYHLWWCPLSSRPRAPPWRPATGLQECSYAPRMSRQQLGTWRPRHLVTWGVHQGAGSG